MHWRHSEEQVKYGSYPCKLIVQWKEKLIDKQTDDRVKCHLKRKGDYTGCGLLGCYKLPGTIRGWEQGSEDRHVEYRDIFWLLLLINWIWEENVKKKVKGDVATGQMNLAISLTMR